jgi:glycosyltransferase involved in cell wall biosynthesis
LGLDNARGEFVVFVDADDTVTPDHLEQFLQSNISEDGIAFTNIFIWRSAHDPNDYRILSLPDCTAGGGREECMPVVIMLIRRRCFSLAVTKMFSRVTIEKNGLRFDESIRYAEDEIFAAQYCAHITHIVCNSRPTYHYRYVEGSLSRGQLEAQMRIRIKDYITEQYRRFGYGDEVLYLSARKQFSRLRHGLRHTESWNGELTNKIAQSILDTYKLLRTYARREFMREFYDRKAMWIARISCAPNSIFWVKLMIKGLHM